jgi:hypothetical protein
MQREILATRYHLKVNTCFNAQSSQIHLMAGNPATLQTAPAWKPGQSGNPGGKPVSARNRLTTRFLYDLAADFEAHGKAAIVKCREEKPDVYIKAIAALCPKEIEVTRPLQELDATELLAAVRALEGYLATGPAQAGVIEPGSGDTVN